MTNPIFKQYDQGEIVLFPARLDESIPEHHLVRVVSSIVDQMDLSELLSGYQGGGTSAYHPRMLLKVLLYGYCMKIYTGRKIANALRSDITFMWLSGKQYPDFRTINNFRSGRLKESVDTIFKSLLSFMFQEQYIRFEEYYCDGTTLQADANKHKVVWKKNQERYRQEVELRIETTLKEIEKLNESENRLYGDNDLPVTGKPDPLYKDKIQQAVETLNNVVQGKKSKETEKKAFRLQKELEADVLRAEIYQEQEAICGNRGGYSKTDEEATPMRIKECKEDLRPAYNAMIGSENQFITGVSVHQNTNDGTCFKEHMKEALSSMPGKVKRVIADAIFGTEENYELLEDEKISGLLKYPSYDKEQEKKFKDNIFDKQNMPYDSDSDTFLCPNGKRLIYKEDVIQKNKNGFQSTLRKYECEDCSRCPFLNQCISIKEEKGNRTIQINKNLERHKQFFREKIQTSIGKALMKQRSHDVETCFGDIKHNQLFRRLHLRGIKKVKAEFTIVVMAHNLRKMQKCMEKNEKNVA